MSTAFSNLFNILYHILTANDCITNKKLKTKKKT